MKQMITLDWLQIYCNGSKFTPGGDFVIKEEPYQTKLFKKIHKVYLWEEEFCTCTSVPTSNVLPPSAMIVKFSNRQLYGAMFKELFELFMFRCQVEYISVTRIDLALDLQTFRNNLHPLNLIKGFVFDKYLKNGRGKFTIHGEQKFTNEFQTLRFGTKTSPVNVYLYNKSIELRQVQDKPYIRARWDELGAVPGVDVWRLEISIKAEGTGFVNLNTGEYDKVSIYTVFETDILHHVYFSFIAQYFAFKINDQTKNKTRMKDLQLFADYDALFKPLYLPNTTGSNLSDKIFIKKLFQFDQEFRGVDEQSGQAQSIIIAEMLRATGLTEWYASKSEGWRKSAHRPY